MAIGIRGSATQTAWSTATASPTLNFPSGVARGDLLLAVFTTNTAHNGAAVVQAGAWRWTKIVEQDDSGNDSTSSLYWAIAPANPGTSFQFTSVFDATESGMGVILALTGQFGPLSIHKQSAVERTVSAGGTASSTATVQTVDNCLIVQLIGCDPGTGTYSATPDTSPTGTERFDAKESTGGSLAYTYIQTYQQGTAASLALDATMALADEYQVLQVAVMEDTTANVVYQGVSSATSATVTVPTGTVDGDLLIVGVWGSSEPTIPSGWTQIGSTLVSGANYIKYAWRVRQSGDTTYTFTNAGWNHCQVFSGHNATTPIQASDVALYSTDANVPLPSLTSSSNAYDCAAYQIISLATPTFTPATNYRETLDSTGVTVGDRMALAASTAYSGTVVASATTTFGTLHAIVKVAGAGAVDASITESQGNSDTPAAQAVFEAARTESQGTSTTEAGEAVIGTAITESQGTSDEALGGLAVAAAITESQGNSDAQDGVRVAVADITESQATSDTPAAQAVFEAARTESQATADTPAAQAVFEAARTESQGTSDTPAASAVLAGAIVEQATGDSAQVGGLAVAAAITESQGNSDTPSAEVIISPGVMVEAQGNSDAAVATVVYAAEVVEVAAPGSIEGAAALYQAEQAEAVISSDLAQVLATMFAAVVETATGTDAQSTESWDPWAHPGAQHFEARLDPGANSTKLEPGETHTLVRGG